MVEIAELIHDFRPMHVDDLDRVVEIEHRAYAFPWSKGIFADCLAADYSCWVMTRTPTSLTVPSKPVVIGHGVLQKGFEEVHLLNVCVMRERQGHGLGRQFVRHLIDQSRKMGGRHLFLEVRPSNRKALRLYNSLGFIEVGRRKDYYPGDPVREDALVLSLDLEDWDTHIN